ncbi:GNAT family N-acetyltransferase [Cryobacterium glucosi]|uniref:GNAT family N-acetyltransferase n=1 Tax=Cryobacterium glucosi TaxID=1259175 RepID=A0ABY2IMI2_9MICO|nr:GNAT family N-acetyltransferase [Cryobacterium glucosi]TFC20634.1 GNAT family N-acetyltransferase [Cryobacterium glucosi]
MNDYTAPDFARTPIDEESAAVLAIGGLELRLIDAADTEARRYWHRATARGFHEGAPDDNELVRRLANTAGDRVTAVLDATAADPLTPVATVRSWPMGLSVPGGGTLPAWAISSVTVSPTHRRRGLARALLTAELRTAHGLGLPLAMLTVSEATIYARYGFGPAAHQASITITTGDARPAPAAPTDMGRLHFVSPESLRHDAPAIFEAARRRGAGDVDRRDSLWDQILGLTTPALAEPSEAAAPTPTTAATPTRQTVRFDDPTGRPKGFAVYSVTLEGDAYPGRLDVVDLVAATDAAYTALWRFLLDLDLIGEVSAPLRSTAEPLVWQLENPRAVRASAERDHLWLRLLDVPAALEHRRYAAPGVFLLDVSDDLGIAGGEFLLTVSPDGAGSAHPLAAAEATPAGAAHLSLSVAALSALYLGGPSAVVLSRAGRVTEHTEDAATQVDAAFRSGQPPHLSTWF